MDVVNKIIKEFHHTKKVDPIAQKFNCSWATVNKIVHATDAELACRGKRKRDALIITSAVTNAINRILDDEENQNVHRKQRHHSPALFKKLKDEGIYHGSPRSLRRILQKIRQERMQKQAPTYLELAFDSGEYLQLDHGEVELMLNSFRIKGYLFVAAVPGKALRYCQVFLTKSQEAWGEFHERAFHFFNGVFKYCIYDNDSVLRYAKTASNTLFMNSLESHYGFEGIFCNLAAGWEKGAVENAVNYCRSNFLPGLPAYESIYLLNDYLKMESHLDTQAIHYREKISKTESFDNLVQKLLPCPSPFLWGKWDDLHVNSMQVVRYGNYQYSVPEKFVGANLKTYITVDKIILYYEQECVYEHDRIYFGQKDALIIEHYLEQLAKKPRAFKYSKVVQQSSFSADLTKVQSMLLLKMEEREAHKEFVQVLLLKRATIPANFDAAIKLAISYGGVASNGISSIIKQLEIEQNVKSLDKELLPQHLLRHTYGECDLYAYQQLIPEGGF